jgi:PHD/YefM family antitoxin component YafN of YafNO toxin-antitoxin module
MNDASSTIAELIDAIDFRAEQWQRATLEDDAKRRRHILRLIERLADHSIPTLRLSIPQRQRARQ